MNRKRLVPAMALMALLSMPACTTTGGLDTERVARVAREAATIGTREALRVHPDWRDEFTVAHDELLRLESEQSVGIDTVLAIVRRLPVKELKSDEARLAVEGATLIIAAIDLPRTDVTRTRDLLLIVTALREGIAAGMATTTPPGP